MKIIARSVFGLMCLLMLFTTGCATIHKSAASGDYAEVKRFLQEGVDVNAKEDGKTPLMSAVYHATPTFWWSEPIIPRLDIVQYLVDKGADVNAKDKDGRTPMMTAKKKRHKNVVEFLKQHGAKE